MHAPTMHLRKAFKGSAGGHTWAHDGAVVEVPEALGMELLAIPDGGYTPHDPTQLAEMPAPEDLPVELAAYVQGLVERHVGDRAADAVGAMTAELTEHLERRFTTLRDELVRDMTALVVERVDALLAARAALPPNLTTPGTAAPDVVSPAGTPSDLAAASVASGAEVPAGAKNRATTSRR